MQDRGLGGFSLSNLRGTTLAVVILFAGAVLGMFGIAFAFKGSVQI